jgi:hypothetical protein
VTEENLASPGTIYADRQGRPWVVLSFADGVAAVAPLAPDQPEMPGDVRLLGGRAIRAAATKLAVPKGSAIGSVSQADAMAARREAERIAAARRGRRPLSPGTIKQTRVLGKEA